MMAQCKVVFDGKQCGLADGHTAEHRSTVSAFNQYEVCTYPEHPEQAHHHTDADEYMKHRHPGCPDDCPQRAYKHAADILTIKEDGTTIDYNGDTYIRVLRSGLPAGLTISRDERLLNWRGDNYVRQTPDDFEPTTAQAVIGVQRWMAMDLFSALGHGTDAPPEFSDPEHADRSWADWWADLLGEVRVQHAEVLAEPPQTTAAVEEHPGDVVADLVQALVHTVEYVGLDMLQPVPGWSWFDALTKHAPDVAAHFAAQRTALHGGPQVFSPATLRAADRVLTESPQTVNDLLRELIVRRIALSVSVKDTDACLTIAKEIRTLADAALTLGDGGLGHMPAQKEET